jgi:cytochrome b561
MSPAVMPNAYSSRQKLLHWIIALFVAGLIPAGLTMTRIGEGTMQDRLYDLHRSFGMVLFVLVLLRVAVRRLDGAPAPSADLTALQRITSTGVHHLLYALLILMPLVGWAGMSAYGGDWRIFDLFMPLPIAPKSEALSIALFRAHDIGAYLTIGLVTLHTGSALFHALVRRDRVLWRMLPERGK